VVVVAQTLRSLIPRALRRTVALVGRMLPRRARFTFARFAAHALRPIIAPVLRRSPGLHQLNSDSTLSLGYILRALTEFDCEFPIEMRIASGSIPEGATLFVTGHLWLAIVCMRRVCEDGKLVHLVRATGEEHRLIGTRIALPVIDAATQSRLIRIRTALRNGDRVAVMVDHMEGDEMMIRSGALALALRLNVPIIFFDATLGRDGVFGLVFETLRGENAEMIAADLLERLRTRRVG